MIQGDNAWTAALLSEFKTPIYLFSIPGLSIYIYSHLPGAVSGDSAFLPYMIIPQGGGQSVNELDGASSISSWEIDCIDPRGELKELLATQAAIGQICTLSLGFPGLVLSDFVVLHTMQITATGWTTEGKVTFTLNDINRYTQYYIFNYGGPSNWQPGMATPPQPPGPAFLGNAQPIGSTNPRWLQGHPLDILLVVYQNELGLGQASTDPGTWQLYGPGNDDSLINPNPFVDVPGILCLRDGQYSDEYMEFKLTSPQTAKSWIESQILKPLGLYTIVRSSGLLALKSMKYPASVVAV